MVKRVRIFDLPIEEKKPTFPEPKPVLDHVEVSHHILIRLQDAQGYLGWLKNQRVFSAKFLEGTIAGDKLKIDIGKLVLMFKETKEWFEWMRQNTAQGFPLYIRDPRKERSVFALMMLDPQGNLILAHEKETFVFEKTNYDLMVGPSGFQEPQAIIEIISNPPLLFKLTPNQVPNASLLLTQAIQ